MVGRSITTVAGAVGVLCMAMAYAGASGFRLDSDEFPIGMFSVDSPGAMAQVARMGVGYVHTYAGGRSLTETELARDRAYLDEAQKNGLKVMFNLNGPVWLKRPDGVAEMLTLVSTFKDHPALGFWYLYDEPDGSCTAAQLKPYYEAIRAATPAIPVAVCTAWSAHWTSHVSVLDLLMVDIYPVNREPFPEAKLDHMTTFTEQALQLGKPVIPINQCFNWRALARGQEPYRGGPAATLRYPEPAELRYWCYAGACQGVRGMFWWGYSQSVQTGYGWIGGQFAPVLREFREFTVLTAPAHRPLIFARARDDDAFMALWTRPAGETLVLVNAWPLTRPLSRWLEEKVDSATLTPWGATRAAQVTLEGGRLSLDRAEPWECFVWKLQRK